MDFLNQHLSDFHLTHWEKLIDDWFFVFAMVFLAFELIRYVLRGQFNWTLVGDTLTNFITLGFFLVINFVLLAGFYLGAYYYTAQFALVEIPNSWAAFAIVLILADLAYYWEHRILHRINILWATHSVHHSSPFFNISVAYRHGPLDGFWPLFFHLPLVLLGFNPVMVLVAELLVQLFQTALHTETVGKLWRPIEFLFNTPSHHRVHHGSNRKYLDKNYGGILIIWDRMFGTFEEEREAVTYGLVTPLDSVNPITAFLQGFYRVAVDAWRMKGLMNKLGVIFGLPGWRPKL